jgi:hypothetical protein
MNKYLEKIAANTYSYGGKSGRFISVDDNAFFDDRVNKAKDITPIKIPKIPKRLLQVGSGVMGGLGLGTLAYYAYKKKKDGALKKAAELSEKDKTVLKHYSAGFAGSIPGAIIGSKLGGRLGGKLGGVGRIAAGASAGTWIGDNLGDLVGMKAVDELENRKNMLVKKALQLSMGKTFSVAKPTLPPPGAGQITAGIRG